VFPAPAEHADTISVARIELVDRRNAVVSGSEGALAAAEAFAVGALAADEAAPEPDAAGGAGVVALNANSDPAAPHGVFTIEPDQGGLQVSPQRTDLVLRGHVHGVAVFGMVVEAADDGFKVAFGGHRQ